MSYWRPSTVEESQLEDLAVKGLVPPKVVAHWRAPPVEHEELHPYPGEIVSFLTFHERGLGHPAQPFLLVLLNEWGVELQHLNPNGVLHIPGFITLCEGFLRIDPHANLFQAFFHERGLTVKGTLYLRRSGASAYKRCLAVEGLLGVHPRGFELGVV
jgi:hypothetical protein